MPTARFCSIFGSQKLLQEHNNHIVRWGGSCDRKVDFFREIRHVRDDLTKLFDLGSERLAFGRTIVLLSLILLRKKLTGVLTWLSLRIYALMKKHRRLLIEATRENATLWLNMNETTQSSGFMLLMLGKLLLRSKLV
jgi:hypothetical protein